MFFSLHFYSTQKVQSRFFSKDLLFFISLSHTHSDTQTLSTSLTLTRILSFTLPFFGVWSGFSPCSSFESVRRHFYTLSSLRFFRHVGKKILKSFNASCASIKSQSKCLFPLFYTLSFTLTLKASNVNHINTELNIIIFDSCILSSVRCK